MDPVDYRAIGVAGIVHLVLFGLWVPWAAIRSQKKLALLAQYPARKQHFRAALIQQAVFAALSILVARAEWIDVFAPHTLAARDFGWGALALAAFIFAMVRRWKYNVDRREPKVELFSPRDATERIQWLLISLLAGVGEEITYRGVMFTLLWRLTGSVDLAAVLSAGAFAVSHMLQGWKSALVILIFALVFQGLVLSTGTLYVAMVVHFLYDATAGLVYGTLCKRRDARESEPATV